VLARLDKDPGAARSMTERAQQDGQRAVGDLRNLVRGIHPSVLAGRGIDVVAGAGDAKALLAAVEAERPDLAVIDVRMPPGHRDEGLRAAMEIRPAGRRSRCWCSLSSSRRATPRSCSRRRRAGSAT
jgi:DNA-binding NarL/FixJ family response regulator